MKNYYGWIERFDTNKKKPSENDVRLIAHNWFVCACGKEKMYGNIPPDISWKDDHYQPTIKKPALCLLTKFMNCRNCFPSLLSYAISLITAIYFKE